MNMIGILSIAAQLVLTLLTLAILLVLGYGLFSRVDGGKAAAVWCKAMFRVGSMGVACACTSDHRYTFSAQCGSRSGAFWDNAEYVVDSVLGDGHCRGAAEREGLTVKQ